ncbi:MFS transporter [Novosphingobium lindaniclasticum]|uniref:MFS transporter n=1 Tax=Novosphingobium lindaniclasticum TaxID=1329895 RepID=UPI0038996830
MENADNRLSDTKKTYKEPGLLVIYPAYYAFLGVVTPYFPLWLQDRGLDATLIAQTTALVMIATMLGQLLLPSAALQVGLRRLAIMAAGAALASTSALALTQLESTILGVAAISGLFCGAMLPIADALVLTGQESGWGGMRACGSRSGSFQAPLQ